MRGSLVNEMLARQQYAPKYSRPESSDRANGYSIVHDDVFCLPSGRGALPRHDRYPTGDFVAPERGNADTRTAASAVWQPSQGVNRVPLYP